MNVDADLSRSRKWCGAMGGTLFTPQEWSRIGQSLNLSPRELQISQAVFGDSKEAAIARQLGISPHTVHTYLERIYRKLEVSGRVQLVVRVVAEHISLMGGLS